MVILYHYSLFNGFIVDGTHGVMIFFMVSGYCMHYSTKNRTGFQFLKARFWRLIPTLVICATLTQVIEWALEYVQPERTQGLKAYIGTILCLPSGNIICDTIWSIIAFKPFNYSLVDGAYWSLLVEIRFYILLWLMYYLLKIKKITISLSIIGLLASFNLSVPLISKSQDFLIYLSFFAFGMAYKAFENKERYSLLILFLPLITFITNCYFGSVALSVGFFKLVHFIGYGICFPFFILIMIVFKNKSNKYISYLGLLSYPIYLLHQDIGLISISLLEEYFTHIISAIITIFIILIISASTQFLVERHLKMLKLCTHNFGFYISRCFSKSAH
jgi:peptidoglycan/LPS O-acetylase OafA/YrhL